MWATARLIETVGCDNVHLSCAATDIAYVEKQYTDGGVDLEPAKKCLQKKCPAQSLPVQRLSDASLPKLRASSSTATSSWLMAGCAAVAISVVAGAFLLRTRPQSEPLQEEDVE